MSEIYDRDSLPSDPATWPAFRSTAIRRMTRVHGPCVVVTREGPYALPDGWDGWIALDTNGWPYPIAADEQARIYEPVMSG